MFTPWPSRVTITQAGRISSVGMLRSRIPPLIVTSDSATVTTPRTAMVKVIGQSVWRDRKSDAVDSGRCDQGHPRTQDDQRPSRATRGGRPGGCQVKTNSPLRPAWPATSRRRAPLDESGQGLFAHRMKHNELL